MKLTPRQVELLLDALRGHEEVVDVREASEVADLWDLIGRATGVELIEEDEA